MCMTACLELNWQSESPLKPKRELSLALSRNWSSVCFQGWTYAIDFPATYTKDKKWNSCVRRRRWIRYRRYKAQETWVKVCTSTKSNYISYLHWLSLTLMKNLSLCVCEFYTWEQIPSEQTESLPDPFNDITCGGWEITEEPRGCLALWAVSLQGKVRTQFIPGLHTVPCPTTPCAIYSFFNSILRVQYALLVLETPIKSWITSIYPQKGIQNFCFVHSSRCGSGVTSTTIILRAPFGRRCPYQGRWCRSAVGRVTWCGPSCGRVIWWSERASAEIVSVVSAVVQYIHFCQVTICKLNTCFWVDKVFLSPVYI